MWHALAMTADPARALQVVVTQVDKNTDGSMTYHFAVKTDPGETLTPGASKAAGDFVTVYNFYGLIDGSAKVPAGWEFSSETSGRTPELNGYPLVLPLDVPNTPNLTWTVTKPVAAGAQIDGFTATTKACWWPRGARDRPPSCEDADTADGDRGTLSPSAHDEARAGTQDLSVSAARCRDHTAKPGVGDGHHLHPDGARLRLSGCRALFCGVIV